MVKLYERSAVIRPLVRIAREYKEKQYNLKDLAPMAIEEEPDLIEAKKRAR